MSTVQLPGSNRFDLQTHMHTGNKKYDVSLAKEFQQHLTKEHFAKIVFLIRSKTINDSRKENGQTDSIMFRIMLIFHTNM